MMKIIRIKIKYNYSIEFDIVLSKDREVMVFHDYDLNRLAGLNKLIKNCTANELRNIKLLETPSQIISCYKYFLSLKCLLKLLNEIKIQKYFFS